MFFFWVSFNVSLVVHLGLFRVSLRVSLEVSFRLFLCVLFRVSLGFI